MKRISRACWRTSSRGHDLERGDRGQLIYQPGCDLSAPPQLLGSELLRRTVWPTGVADAGRLIVRARAPAVGEGSRDTVDPGRKWSTMLGVVGLASANAGKVAPIASIAPSDAATIDARAVRAML